MHKHPFTEAGRWLPISKDTVKVLGINTAYFLSELLNRKALYLEKKQLDKGWFYATVESVQEETTLSLKQQQRCIEALEGFGLIKKRLIGFPAVRFFFIPDNIADLCKQLEHRDMPKGNNSRAQREPKKCPKGTSEVPKGNNSRAQREPNRELSKEELTKREVVVQEVEKPEPPPHRVTANPLPEFSATTTAEKLAILKEQANEFYKTLIADDIQTELLRKNNRVGNHPLTIEQLKFHLTRFCKYKVETAQKGWHRYDDFRHNFSLFLPTSIARAKEEGGAVYVRPETPAYKRPAN